jgi:AGZA family xanthine/uracil permease-like MFS transporter
MTTSTGERSGGFLEQRFRLSERQTTVRTEVLAGVTTFMTMAYILFVNPAIWVPATTGCRSQPCSRSPASLRV